MPAPEALFANYVFKSGLTQLLSEPTRDNNILDLLLMNDPQAVFYTAVTEPFSISDHNAIQWSIMLPICAYDGNFDHYNNVNMYDVKRANYDALLHYLGSVNWITLFTRCAPNDVEKIWNIFISVVMSAVA